MMETEKSAHFCCGTVGFYFYMLVLTLFIGFYFCQGVCSFAACSAEKTVWCGRRQCALGEEEGEEMPRACA